jgi:hypothetical protein
MKIRHLFAALLALAVVAQAHAGSACVEAPPDANNVMRALELAQKSSKALDESGARVAMIARVGQDLSKYHLKYSHMAFVWRPAPGQPWSVIHELNQCGTANSSLFDEGLGNLFLDNMFSYQTMIVIPSAQTQDRLAAILAHGDMIKFHGRPYNMLAYPFSTDFQNSNQWLLETLASAMAQDTTIANRSDAQAWLKLAGYRPTTLDVPMMTRLGADFFRANISFNDHPFGDRMAGHIDTVTVESVVNFVARKDPGLQRIELAVD